MALPNDPITAINPGDHATGAIASAPHDELLENDQAMDAILSAATSVATANALIKRDSVGRAKVAAPGVASDIALKATVTDDIAIHDANHSTAHGAVSAATASHIIVRDASGRAQVAAPSAAADIARYDTVTAHSNLTGTSTPHGATSAATGSTVMKRDASGRAKVGAPSADDDIALKSTVNSVVLWGQVASDGTLVATNMAQLGTTVTVTKASTGVYTIGHGIGSTAYGVTVTPAYTAGAHKSGNYDAKGSNTFQAVITVGAEDSPAQPYDSAFDFVIFRYAGAAW